MGTETLGLRERKRIATRQLIEHTAVELVLDLGYDEVTVEKICEACNLSTRTFFNYFPTKDAAIGGLMLVVPSETTMLTLIGEHPDDPLRGALAVFEAAMQIVDDDPICSRIDANCSSVIPRCCNNIWPPSTILKTRSPGSSRGSCRTEPSIAACTRTQPLPTKPQQRSSPQAPRCVTSSENGRTVNGQAPEQICSIRHYS